MIYLQRISTAILFQFTVIAALFVISVIQTSQASEKPNWVQVKYTEVEEERVLNAVVEAVHKATISAQISGRVIKINADVDDTDRKSTRLNSSHITISYAVFCLKKKNVGDKRCQELLSVKLATAAL